MWLLIMLLLQEVPGIDRITVLNEFATEHACVRARNHVGFEMAEAYPNDRTFVILCWPRRGVAV